MNAKTKNALIGGLLAIVFVMAVGYAAFAQQLTINGTAEITSKWDVHIESIVAQAPVGTATDVPYAESSAEDGTHKVSNTVAQFKANLVAPGDSISYQVTVKNEGTLAAKLSKITENKGTENPAINFTYSGITEESTLSAGDNVTFTVTVTYNSAIESQPESTSGTYSLALDYVQA